MATTAAKRDNAEINEAFDFIKQTLVYIHIFVIISESIYATLISSNFTACTHSATSILRLYMRVRSAMCVASESGASNPL